jgi:hypothetical protein
MCVFADPPGILSNRRQPSLTERQPTITVPPGNAYLPEVRAISYCL